MSGRLRIALAAQVAFFALWGSYLIASHDGAPTVWVATEPVDPRDLLSGHYVALRYRFESVAAAGCDAASEDWPPPTVYVQLAESGETVMTDEGLVAITDAVACRTEPPEVVDGERWIAGQLDSGEGGPIHYGIERFYVGETSELRQAQSGSVVAKLAIAADFQARIVALVPVRTPTDAPPADVPSQDVPSADVPPIDAPSVDVP